MAIVTNEDPIHHLSGKISKKYRTCYNYRKRSDRKYTSIHSERSTPVKETELAQRAKFKAVSQAARLRMLDPNHADMDQLGFSRQDKYTTLFGYVFRQVWDSYEEE